MTLTIATIVDMLLLLMSLWFILQTSDRSVFNPSLWYVALHTYSVTFRLVRLNAGAQSAPFIGVRSDAEIVNAAIAADIALLAVAAATILVAHRAHQMEAISSNGSDSARLSPFIGVVISLLCLTIGTYALVKFGGVAIAAQERGVDASAIDIGEVGVSSIPRIIAGFAIQGALILCAMRGFKGWRLGLLLVMVALNAVNLARTFFILPVLMAILIYQTIRRKPTLSLRWVAALATLGIVWFVFKPVRLAIQAGEDPAMIWAAASNYLEDSIHSGSGDTQFLDMQASYMAAADEEGKRFYGSTVLPLMYLPIPRFVWPDKPRLNEYATELTSSSRPMVQGGMTPNLTGESYLNFGWIGCAAIPFLYIYCMQIAYLRVKALGVSSASRWVYLVFLVSMVQVFRDGLNALVLFPLMNFLPLACWGVMSMLLPAKRTRVSTFRGTMGLVPVVKRRQG